MDQVRIVRPRRAILLLQKLFGDTLGIVTTSPFVYRKGLTRAIVTIEVRQLIYVAFTHYYCNHNNSKNNNKDNNNDNNGNNNCYIIFIIIIIIITEVIIVIITVFVIVILIVTIT